MKYNFDKLRTVDSTSAPRLADILEEAFAKAPMLDAIDVEDLIRAIVQDAHEKGFDTGYDGGYAKGQDEGFEWGYEEGLGSGDGW